MSVEGKILQQNLFYKVISAVSNKIMVKKSIILANFVALCVCCNFCFGLVLFYFRDIDYKF